MLIFENENQRKGFGALSIWLRKYAISSRSIRYIDVYLIQKFHDVSEWIIESTGTQITLLQNELKLTQDMVEELREEITKLKAVSNERNSVDVVAPKI